MNNHAHTSQTQQDKIEQSLPPIARRLDKIIEYTLASLLTLAPLACGAVDAWAHEAVLGLAGVMLLCFLLRKTLVPSTHVQWSWAYVPLGVLILLIAVQLLPLPIGWIETISPRTASMKAELLSDLPGGAHPSGQMTLSFYPQATERQLWLGLAVAAVFFVVLNSYRSEAKIRRLLIVICAVGGFVALLQLLHVVTQTDKLYWQIPIVPDTTISGGTFGVSYNSYAQFMNLSIGAGIGYMFLMWIKDLHGRFSLSDYLRDVNSKRIRRLWWVMLMILLGAASICASGSRGGILSMAGAGAMVVLLSMFIRRLRPSAWGLVLIASGVLVCLLYVGLEAIFDRLATLGDFSGAYHYRWIILQDSLRVWWEFPLFGSGLGTHEMIYPMFSHMPGSVTITHAENEYVQMLEEVGLLGLMCIFTFVLIIIFHCIRCVRRAVPSVSIVAVGLGFGLLAVGIHSWSDFGLHKPANACLAAVFCALLIGIGTITPRKLAASEDSIASSGGKNTTRIITGAIFLVMLALWGWGLWNSHAVSRAESSWRQAESIRNNIRKQGWAADNEEFADLIFQAEQAVLQQPKNIEYRYWLNYFRWRSISRAQVSKADTIFLPTTSLGFASRIAEDVNQARRLCPTYGPPASLAGELQLCVLGQPEGESLIRKGLRLNPRNAEVNFTVGILDAMQEHWEKSEERFAMAIDLDGELFLNVAQFCVLRLSKPELAEKLAGDSFLRLRNLMRLLKKHPPFEDRVGPLRTKLIGLLSQKCQSPDASLSELSHLGNYCFEDGQNAQAANYYRRALEINNSNVYLRLQLAHALDRNEKYSDAISEVKMCLSQNPGLRGAKGYLEHLLDQKTRAEIRTLREKTP